MYPTVRAEMARRNISALDLSHKTGIRYQTLTLKLSGMSPVSIREAKAIRDAIDPALTLDALFATEEEGAVNP
jgi:hypothetical protein